MEDEPALLKSLAMLTAQDLAKAFQVGIQTIDNMLAREELPPPIRCGRLRRWPLKDLEEWLKTKKEVNQQ